MVSPMPFSPVHSARKFSAVLGTISANNSKTIRPTEEKKKKQCQYAKQPTKQANDKRSVSKIMMTKISSSLFLIFLVFKFSQLKRTNLKQLFFYT